ncbi:hypothetical protein GobsT_71750 [Gemmata obscuriglobus]|uniref:Uncharacterized protein n=2 Tax=Gemmata obscuriglobus TaxID=114 RepID=A0A2Z3HBH1_9BACT|nr:hypothetical protein C1280_35205 [Gemmata obscuriglobus]QEG32320.1 hypothetical protein GobsT_71750 [Gemmata obscuriglobus]VTS11676.1 unnamed protein product [Gemmata obscuriglobus UQM 2246]
MRRLALAAALGWTVRDRPAPKLPAAVRVLRVGGDPAAGKYTPFHVNDRGRKFHTGEAVEPDRAFMFHICYPDGSVTYIYATRD